MNPELDTLVANVAREQIAPLIVALAARLLEQPAQSRQPEAENYLSVEEASKRWRRSPRWFYRNAKRLPFCKRLSRKVLMVGERGMERWIAAQTA